MTRLYLIRHGQTAWNAQERFRGRANLPLTELGRRQAQALARSLAPKGIAALYASPLGRAQETAAPLAKRLSLPVVPLAGVIDIDYGRWQGLSPDEAQAADPALYRLWEEEPHRVVFPGGEGLAAMQERAAAAVEETLARHPHETVAVVSHRMVLKALLCHLMGLKLSQFWQIEQEVAAVNLFETRESLPGEGLAALLINDTCHLEGLA